jgi:hypothetical protein
MFNHGGLCKSWCSAKSSENILFSIFPPQLLLPMSSGDDQEVKIGVIHCLECEFDVYIDFGVTHAELQCTVTQISKFGRIF